MTEGERSKFIKLQTNVPPQVFCGRGNNGDCQIHIESLIKQCDTGCPWDKTMPQVVIGWTGSSVKNSFCGTVVSETDWERMIKIPVKATIDGIRDGDQTVKVSLQVKVVGKVSTIYKLNPYRVTVSMPTFCTYRRFITSLELFQLNFAKNVKYTRTFLNLMTTM